MQPLLRKALVSDAKAILQLERQCFVSDKILPRQMRYLLGQAKACCQVVQSGEDIIAYVLCLTPALPRPARIYSLAVSPKYQGQGLAQRLMASIEQVTQNLGYKSLRLEVSNSNPKARVLYEHLGYMAIAPLENYYADGSDGVRMQKILQSHLRC